MYVDYKASKNSKINFILLIMVMEENLNHMIRDQEI